MMIVIGSHDESSLHKFSGLVNFQTCLFSSLAIKEFSAPEKFAESQIFFGAQKILLQGTYTGLVSPRFHERYPRWPSLDQIDELIEQNNIKLSTSEMLAPQAFSCKVKNLRYWMALQNLAHPGMGNILSKLQLVQDVQNRKQKGVLVMGNTFIMSRISAPEFLNKWMSITLQLELSNESSYRYIYRCLKCGLTSENGVGRWGSNRHPSYLMERITALATFTLEQNRAFKIKNNRMVKRKLIPINFATYHAIFLFHKVSVFLYKISKQNCNHLHFQPGKLG